MKKCELLSIAREAIRLKDICTHLHHDHVSHLSEMIALDLGYSEFDSKLIGLYSSAHDIGKLFIDSQILKKPSTLSDRERAVVRRHSEYGYDWMVKSLEHFDDEYLINKKLLLDIILYHHERLDGSGYPYGLKGGEIREEVRIVTVADCYDAMTSRRVYNSTLNHEEAIDELDREVIYGRLDKRCVDSLKKLKGQ